MGSDLYYEKKNPYHVNSNATREAQGFGILKESQKAKKMFTS